MFRLISSREEYKARPRFRSLQVLEGIDAEVAFDTTTLGNWSGVYGGYGWHIPVFGGTSTTRFSYAGNISDVSMVGGSNYWESGYDSAANALQDPLNTSIKKGGVRFFDPGSNQTGGYVQWTSSIPLRVSVYITAAPGATRSVRCSLRTNTDTILGPVRTIAHNSLSAGTGVWVTYSVKAGVRRITFDQATGFGYWNAIFFSPL